MYKLPLTLVHFAHWFAATSGKGCSSGAKFFSFPTWYEYLPVKRIGGSCAVQATPNDPGQFFHFLPLIGLAILDILLRIAGIVAIIFVIYGGVQLITSAGSPEGAAKARGTILNALIGLLIAVIAVAFVAFVGNSVANSH
jgi:hypothetical protein